LPFPDADDLSSMATCLEGVGGDFGEDGELPLNNPAIAPSPTASSPVRTKPFFLNGNEFIEIQKFSLSNLKREFLIKIILH
jgi:hypothetical protein